MKKLSFIICLCIVFSSVRGGHAGFLDFVKERVGMSTKEPLDEDAIVSGLKEALAIGTKNAVKSVSQFDGYFGDEIIRIGMPEKLRKVAEVLEKIGYQEQVDHFILSMNRAAERAAPEAASIFAAAIKDMSLEDARGILIGGDTAATDYFKSKTSDEISEAFKPIISSSMNDVGVTRLYKGIMDKYTSLPFMQSESLDLDRYVTNKSLDGLFYMLGQEEKSIRTNPEARVTELLQNVFGN